MGEEGLSENKSIGIKLVEWETKALIMNGKVEIMSRCQSPFPDFHDFPSIIPFELGKLQYLASGCQWCPLMDLVFFT